MKSKLVAFIVPLQQRSDPADQAIPRTINPVNQSVSARPHLPGLDGLRALAVIGVLAFHDNRLSGGFLGVDLFFAVSGFLITTLLIDELQRTNTIDLIGFWGRRLRRLLPAVMVLLVVVVIFFRLFADTGQWIIARNDAPWAQFYVANWHQISSGAGYWDAFAAPSAFEHLWSLAIEEQFYVVWPVLVIVAWRIGRTRALGVLAGIGIIASFVAMLTIYDGGDPTRVYMGTDTRAFSLLCGAFVALPAIRHAITQGIQKFRRAASGLTAALIAAIGFMWFTVSGESEWLFRGGLLAHSITSALLAVLIASLSSNLSVVFSWRPLAYIGRLSYALYLWHWPVFIFCTRERLDVDGLTLTAIRMAITLALSIASYYLIEQPIRHKAKWAHGSQGRKAFVVTTLAAIIIWTLIAVPKTTNKVNADALTSAVVTTTTTDPSLEVTTTTSTTLVKQKPLVSSLYYLGDSVAYDMWPAIEAELNAANVNVHSGAFGGVGIVPTDVNTTPLQSLAVELDRYVVNLLILQLSVWDAQQGDDQQQAALVELAKFVADRNLQLVFVSFPSIADDRSEPGQISLEDKARAIADQSDGSIIYLDQRSVLGDVFIRDIDGDGNPERKRDGIHVCPTGALRSAQWLIQELSTRFEGITAPVDDSWVTGEWAKDSRYDSPPGACAPL
jgi:peptidoglycan/LPS O-acetylase OafA/YrhL